MLKEYENRIRPIAISIIKKNDKILVYRREDDITKKKFYRFQLILLHVFPWLNSKHEHWMVLLEEENKYYIKITNHIMLT